ncbi:MAG: ThiF family adenylyltransferase [Nitrosarchaeum sp.]|nr:ThiF family adenylyltransferase [Nitrosarchaeum sp.]
MNTIRITKEQFDILKKYLLSRKEESAAFLLAGYFYNSLGHNFAIREIMIPRDDEYNERTEIHLDVSAKFFNRVLSSAERTGTTIVQCHSHTFADYDLSYSASDNYGESQSSQTIFDCLEKKPMASLLFGKNNVIGRFWNNSKNSPMKINQIRILGKNIQIFEPEQTNSKLNTSVFDRQIKAFGIKGQQVLSSLKIGIVGLGGTGSSVAEQLAREGIGDFLLIDHDKFEISNLTRLYGSYHDTKKKPKVQIIKSNIEKINPKAIIEAVDDNVVSQKILQKLKNCDVIFSCTDNHTSRSVLNELCYQYFIPVIDIGVGIDSDNEKISGGTVRSMLISPSLPCMYCTGIINSEQILNESLPPKERKSRQKEGYVQGMQDDVPSVITFTTMAATFGLTMFKDLYFNILDSKSTIITLDLHSFTINKLSASQRPECVCKLRLAKGDYFPLSAP